MSLRTLSKPWLVDLAWDELVTLVACLGLDFIDYLIPVLMTPIYGDILDLAGVIFCGIFFRWLGFVSLIELIPGLDVLPNFTITWLIWYVNKKRWEKSRLEDELEHWR
ncbi:hypothetical protein AC482_05980 [miscellaneous Crenarchaeota group-15 archaeon DG-45]|uniref:Uncharacterized protein n=1 Tax=miscellaneous Crenarchaeota group-15 archaeon DG-45 TaxID=1685127 RepID=A0A0M0BM76_9ARCH|nr:MAG: hypothetical protein AC482_05980 [miscellaneous Crenarchaeota group-15 archaeon DG-45]